MDRIYTIYIHKDKTDGKVYIGLTKQKPESRWGHNGINYKDKCPHFWNAIEYYGWDNFEHIIYASGLTREEAATLEKKLIAEYKAQNREFGYNILEGGAAPSIPPEVREKMSKAMMGNKNGLGKPCSEEKKKKISDALKGRTFTEEHKRHISEAKMGVSTGPCSPEKRANIIKNKKDKKTIRCIETNQIYESIHECARQLGLSATAICAVCRGRHKTTGGYHFEYYENDTIKA